VRLLRAALHQYGIAGIKPVESGLQQTIGAMSREHAVVADELEVATDADKNFLARVSRVIARTATDEEQVDKIYKGGKAAFGIAKADGDAWHWLTNFCRRPARARCGGSARCLQRAGVG
jgi:hypothetical protein